MIVLDDRFWSKVDKNGPIPAHCPELGNCWIWTASRNRLGRGMVGYKSKQVQAHRLAWMSENYEIGPEIHVLHHCDNTACVRPFHLFKGTHQDNMDDCVRKGRPWNTRKTHCKRGHEFTKENTYIMVGKYTSRCCRKCHAAKVRRHRIERR